MQSFFVVSVISYKTDFHTAQQMSLADGVFFVLPLFCWYPVRIHNMLRHLNKADTWFWIAGVELLVS